MRFLQSALTVVSNLCVPDVQWARASCVRRLRDTHLIAQQQLISLRRHGVLERTDGSKALFNACIGGCQLAHETCHAPSRLGWVYLRNYRFEFRLSKSDLATCDTLPQHFYCRVA